MAAKAELETQRSLTHDAPVRLNDLTIRAPFTGIVSQREAGRLRLSTTDTHSANSSSILLLIDRLEY